MKYEMRDNWKEYKIMLGNTGGLNETREQIVNWKPGIKTWKGRIGW